MKVTWVRAGWALVFALVLVSLLGEPPRDELPRRSGFVPRLLGPVAGLAAGVQWIRVNHAIRDGRPALAFARAEVALHLDPGATLGWELLAAYQGFTLASSAHELEPERRRAWLEAGLATARRGEAAARRPERLALTRGLMLLVHAEQDPDLPWPGGAAALLADAAAAFEEAAALGHPDGADLAAYCREAR